MDLASYLYFLSTAPDDVVYAHLSRIALIIAFFIGYVFYDHDYFVEHVYKPLFASLCVFYYCWFQLTYWIYLLIKQLFLLIFPKLKGKALSDVLGNWVSALRKFFDNLGK